MPGWQTAAAVAVVVLQGTASIHVAEEQWRMQAFFNAHEQFTASHSNAHLR
jgi:hypothetical protein